MHVALESKPNIFVVDIDAYDDNFCFGKRQQWTMCVRTKIRFNVIFGDIRSGNNENGMSDFFFLHVIIFHIFCFFNVANDNT